MKKKLSKQEKYKIKAMFEAKSSLVKADSKFSKSELPIENDFYGMQKVNPDGIK